MTGRALPSWLSGAFAAMIAAAVITTYSAVLNSTVALYSVDFHPRLFGRVRHPWRFAGILTVGAMIVSLIMVPAFMRAESIINLLQELNGLLSMPILSAFATALLFRGVQARASCAGVVWGVAVYALYTFYLSPAERTDLHYIDVMVLVFASSVAVTLVTNKVAFGARATFAPRAMLERTT